MGGLEFLISLVVVAYFVIASDRDASYRD